MLSRLGCSMRLWIIEATLNMNTENGWQPGKQQALERIAPVYLELWCFLS
jgi:hypothetical protein